MTDAGMGSEAVRRAAVAAARHPRVIDVGSVHHQDDGVEAVEITFCVPLPNEWRMGGKSPSTGVRAEEQVRFDFPRDYPLLAPNPSLRPDFTRNLPHIQPCVTSDGRPVPCIYDGELRELLHHEGWPGILNHAAVWLERAATLNLIAPDQGWEPVRRDYYRDYTVADAKDIQQVVDTRGGSMFRRAVYMRLVFENGNEQVRFTVLPERMHVNKDVVPSTIEEWPILLDGSAYGGKSLAVLVWPGKHPSGKPILNDTYWPETVSNVKDLKERARQYGCSKQLSDALRVLRKALSHWAPRGPFKLVVLLLARRPFSLIGCDSQIEMCPYVVDIHSPNLFASGPDTPVHAAAHRHQISRDLLAQMAGDSLPSEELDWTLLGAGSLGSKIAVHLARAGRGPRIVVDRSALSPHNAARHALIPIPDESGFLWTHDKATALCGALRGLKTEATPVTADVVEAIRSQSNRRYLGKKPWAIVNATASLAVQEALASTAGLPKSRVIETSLFGGGSVGVLTVEGPGRNPNTADLMAECYRLISEDASSEIVFGNDGASRQQVGQGCGSLTMTMSDGRLSLFAASMAEYLLGKQSSGLSDRIGEALIGRLSSDGLSLAWQTSTVEAVDVVKMESGSWCVRIGPFAKRKIESEVRRQPNIETGGALIGRLSEANRSVHVVDVLDAPEDSVKARGEFVLGTKGLRRRISSYINSTGGALYCVGTWHSHLVSSGPSKVDKATAKLLSLAEQSPLVLLIHTPSGFRGLLADVC